MTSLFLTSNFKSSNRIKTAPSFITNNQSQGQVKIFLLAGKQVGCLLDIQLFLLLLVEGYLYSHCWSIFGEVLCGIPFMLCTSDPLSHVAHPPSTSVELCTEYRCTGVTLPLLSPISPVNPEDFTGFTIMDC